MSSPLLTVQPELSIAQLDGVWRPHVARHFYVLHIPHENNNARHPYAISSSFSHNHNYQQQCFFIILLYSTAATGDDCNVSLD